MKTSGNSPEVSWDEVHQAFAPFAGSCLYAIRAEAFFHLASRHHRPGQFWMKNIFYPAAVRWRSRAGASRPQAAVPSPYWLVCDYGAEPGLGTLLPLLRSCPEAATLVVNAQVLAAQGGGLAQLPQVYTVCADSGPRDPWRSRWRRSSADYRRLYEMFPSRLRPWLRASRRVVQALLARAYGYEQFYEERFSRHSPRALITHNDFTALSYLAGEVARRRGIPDFTLQHGFPSQEYFPASASHYLVWGTAFQQAMNGRARNGTRFALTGAPRLDAIASAEERRDAAREKLSRLRLIVPGKLNVLFLSQSHTPLFSPSEHHQILSLAGSLAQEPWIHLMVRPHPQEAMGVFHAHAGFRHAAIIPPKISLTEAVLASEVVVSVNSTAMLEAALLHAPVVQLALPSLEHRLGLLRFPRQARDADSARSQLWQLRAPAERSECVGAQQPLVRACVHDPGRGTENVWRYIHDHSGEKRGAPVASAGPA